jgi:hypothetical protein
VIFSIAGAGAVVTLDPVFPGPMIIYEWTTITGDGTTSQPVMDLFPEIRRLVAMTPRFEAPVERHVSPASLMHSSHSFVQAHRLRMRITDKALTITIDGDPVLVLFNATKRTLYVYTGTTAYRLAVFLDRPTGQLGCYCMRQTAHMEDTPPDHVTLAQLTTHYGTLCSNLTIEILPLILTKRDTQGFVWASVDLT